MEKDVAKLHILYQSIKKFINENGVPPTVRELMGLSGYTSTSTIYRKLLELKKMDFIEWDGKSRSIRIVKTPRNDIKNEAAKIPGRCSYFDDNACEDLQDDNCPAICPEYGKVRDNYE